MTITFLPSSGCAASPIWRREGRARPPRNSARSLIGAGPGFPSTAPSLTWTSPARWPGAATLRRARRPTRTFWPCGRMPTRTCPSCERRRRNTQRFFETAPLETRAPARRGSEPLRRLLSVVDMRRRFSRALVAAIDESAILRVRAGARSRHRFVGIWAVVVEGRVLCRSWTEKPRGWYRTFLEDPLGTIQVGERQVPVRAVRARGE